jgi:hypothetical protein
MKGLIDVVRGKESATFDNAGVATSVKGPIETLRTLIIIEKDGGISRIDFPVTGKNPYVYGRVTITNDGVSTQRLSGPPSAETEVIIRQYSPDFDASATYLQANAPGDVLVTQSLTSADLQTVLTAAKQYWLNMGANTTIVDSAHVTVGELPAGVAGQTLLRPHIKAFGMLNRKQLPPPARSSHRTSPWWWPAICLTRLRPSPTPPAFSAWPGMR